MVAFASPSKLGPSLMTGAATIGRESAIIINKVVAFFFPVNVCDVFYSCGSGLLSPRLRIVLLTMHIPHCNIPCVVSVLFSISFCFVLKQHFITSSGQT